MRIRRFLRKWWASLLVVVVGITGVVVFSTDAQAATPLPFGTAAATGAYAACNVFYWVGKLSYTSFGYTTYPPVPNGTTPWSEEATSDRSFLGQVSTWRPPMPEAWYAYRYVCTWAYGGTSAYRSLLTKAPEVQIRYATAADAVNGNTRAGGFWATDLPSAPTWITDVQKIVPTPQHTCLVPGTGLYVACTDGVTVRTNAVMVGLDVCAHDTDGTCPQFVDGITKDQSGFELAYGYPASFFAGNRPQCTAEHRQGAEFVGGTIHGTTVAARGCVVTSATEATSLLDLINATGGFDHQGVGSPPIYWTGEWTHTKGAGLPPLSGVSCSLTTKATPSTKTKISPKVHFRVTVTKVKTVLYAARWTYGGGQFSTGTTNWTLTYTYTGIYGTTSTGFASYTVIARVYARLTITGTDQLYSESENCHLHLTITAPPGTTTGVGTTTVGEASGSTVTGVGGTSTCSEVQSLIGLLTSFTPFKMVVCPLEYVFIPSKAQITSLTSFAGNAATSSGAEPASTWLYQIVHTAADVPLDLYDGIHTATGECTIPTIQLRTVPAADAYTFCVGYSDAIGDLHGTTTWVVILGDVVGALFSLFMLIAMWYFMMGVASKTAVGANSAPPAHTGSNIGEGT